MLSRLRLENIAIIEALEIEFASGLNLLTGETGAGKSIIVDSLGLLLGGRVSSDIIRGGAESAAVEAEFMFERGSEVARALCERLDCALDGDSRLILRREVGEKRSRAFLQGRAVPVAVLRDAASALVSIHGQHEHQQLFDASSHLRLLDAFGGHAELAAQVAELAARTWRAREELRRLERSQGEAERRRDYLRYQVDEIRGSSVVVGEEESLRQERLRLVNADRIRSLASAAAEAIYAGEESATEQVVASRKGIDELAKVDPTAASVGTRLAEVVEILRESSRALESIAAVAEPDPARLEAVEERLHDIEKLKKKYGPDIATVLDAMHQAETELAQLERLEVDTRDATERAAAAERAWREAAERLSEKRREATRRLAKSVRRELSDLAMPGTRFDVVFSEAPGESPSESGNEVAEFHISANPGEPLRPLVVAASGGELSRVMLALRSVANDTRTERTLVFDEIDAGVGGTTAEVIGRKLAAVARRQQVLCVTHLPQVAAFADHHVAVSKVPSGGRTAVQIALVEGEERTIEIARMMGSAEPSAAALRHAREILGRAAVK